jgi:hypothetical protein
MPIAQIIEMPGAGREVLAPLGFAGAPRCEFTVHKLVVTDSAAA